MRGKRLRQATAVGLAVVMACSMMGCGKKGENSGGKKQEDTKNFVYSATPIELADAKGSASNAFVIGDTLYFSTYEYTASEDGFQDAIDSSMRPRVKSDKETEDSTEAVDGEDATEDSTGDNTTEDDTSDNASSDVDGDYTADDGMAIDMPAEGSGDTTIYHYYKCNVSDGSGLEELTAPEMKDSQWVNAWMVDTDGNMLFMITEYSDTSGNATISLLKTGADGKEIYNVDITKDLGMDESSSPSSAMLDQDNNVIVVMDSRVVVFDKDGKKKGEAKADQYLECTAVAKDGKVLCGYSEEGGPVVQVLDMEKMAFTDQYKLDISYFYGTGSLMQGNGDYDFYYRDASAIYGYSMADKKSRKILDFVASDINAQNVGYLISMSDGSFLAGDYGMGKGETAGAISFNRYTKVDPSTIKDKVMLTLGGTYIGEDIKQAVIEYNKQSDKYKITIKEYSDADDPTQKFAADIVAGNIPDIISMSDFPVGQYISKGLLEDLTPYFEKDKLDQDLIPSISEAMKTDGKYYYVSPFVALNTMAGNSEIVGAKPGWSVSDLIKITKEQKGKSVPFYQAYRSSLIYTLIYACMTDYVDWNTGKCNFDSKEFQEALEFCKENGAEDDYDFKDYTSADTAIRQGKAFLEDLTLDMETAALTKKLFNGKQCFIGYPSGDGSGNGAYFYMNSMFSMSSKSENKDAAWDFLSSLMSKKYEAQHSWYGIPTRKDAYEMYKKERTATKKYTDEFGKEVEPLDSHYQYEDSEITIGPLSDEDVKLFEDVLNNTTKVNQTDYQLTEIITEEAAAYFSGDKTVEDVCKIIQNRISTYVNENR